MTGPDLIDFTPPPSTPADHERLRLAAQKRARKAERLRRTLSHG